MNHYLLKSLCILCLTFPAQGVDARVNKTLFGGLAIEGYDPVSYFTEGKPVKGKKSFEHGGKEVIHINYFPAEECEAFLSEAVELSRQGPLPKATRIAVLEKAASLIREQAETLALQIALEGGKPYQDAHVEALRAAASVKSSAETLGHTVHHHAIICFMLSNSGIELPMGFGVAPSTRRHEAKSATSKV